MNTTVFHFAPHELEHTLKILNDAIRNHRSWFDTLHTAMLCGLQFPDDILNDSAHRCCQFGRWYYGNEVSDTIRAFKEFGELEACHKFMHDNARELAIKCQNKQGIRPDDYKPFLDNQHHLIDLLNSLHDMLIEHQFCFDALTGAVNRKSISLLLEQSFENVKRYDLSFSVAMLDADHFKQINDNYGHMVGDQVLKQISIFLRRALRKTDCVGRYGGEEFIILMPETEEGDACKVLDQCRDELSKHDIDTGDGKVNVTVSIGITQLHSDDDDAWQAVKRADFALYRAKESGRNQVKIAESE